MARVVLINPNRMKPAVAPIALDYIADSLDAAGHEVDVLDLCFSDDWALDVDTYFRTDSPDLVGMTVRNTDDCYFASQDCFIPFFRQVVDRIHALTDAPVVLGGAGLSVAPEAVLKATGAEYAVKGDGERALSLLADRRSNPCDIPGLVYWQSGEIRSNPAEWPDVSMLPSHDRRWLDMPRYFAEGGQAGIETKRGCDRKCIYCADPIGKGRRQRLRRPSTVVHEIRALLDQGIDCYHLCDSEFNIPLRHALDVCTEIIESGLGDSIRWYTYASPVPFTDELAELMVRAGCVGIDFGADSGDDRVLGSLGRDFTCQDVRSTAEICHRHGITFMYDLLIGGPSETRESVAQTIGLMKEIEPHRVGVSVGVRIYNGTELGRMVLRGGLSESNPALYGRIADNEDLLYPVYYISPEVGLEIVDYISDLIQGDPRFFHASRDQLDGNYNYNENAVLVDAIRAGYRGAYWDILRRVQEGQETR